MKNCLNIEFKYCMEIQQNREQNFLISIEI